MAPFPSLRKLKSKRRLKEENAQVDRIISSERIQQSLNVEPGLSNDIPTISDAHNHYIQSLDEGHQPYARFFSALFIAQADHPSFYSDLRSFRSQPSIITLFLKESNPSPPLPSGLPGLNPFASPADSKAITTAFLASPFAHPWCSTNVGAGWRKASLGATAKRSKEDAKEEQRLHQLLVPIWCAFRRRMCLTDEQVDRLEVEFAEQAKAKVEELARKEAEAEAKAKANVREKGDSRNASSSSPPFVELGFKKYSPHDTRASQQLSGTEDVPPRAASGLFMGAAVAGFIMSDKRVSRYIEKKLKK